MNLPSACRQRVLFKGDFILGLFGLQFDIEEGDLILKTTTLVIATLALLIGGVEQIWASVISINDSGEGWISPQQGVNGNGANNNYIAGSNEIPAQFRDHFDFSIPILSGAVTGASFSLNNPDHVGGANTFSLYSLGTFGTYGYSGIGAGTFYGSLVITAGGLETITLNAAAISDIQASQGGTFSLGGVNSGEAAYPNQAFDFGFSGDTTVLTLTTASVPEPTSLALAGIGAVGLVLGGIRRRRQMLSVV